MNQKDFADVVDCAESTLQAVERGPERLKLSEGLAVKISIATGVSAQWLLANNFKKPPINREGEQYTKADFEKAQAEGKTEINEKDSEWWIEHAREISAQVLSSARKRNPETYRIAVYKLLASLDALADEFGLDESALPLKPPRAGVLVNKVTRRDIPHAGLKTGGGRKTKAG